LIGDGVRWVANSQLQYKEISPVNDKTMEKDHIYGNIWQSQYCVSAYFVVMFVIPRAAAVAIHATVSWTRSTQMGGS
jgi:hypothetical protein